MLLPPPLSYYYNSVHNLSEGRIILLSTSQCFPTCVPRHTSVPRERQRSTAAECRKSKVFHEKFQWSFQFSESESESESSFNWAKTPQLTKRNCDLQINVGLHDYKDKNVITINNKQAQLLLLCSRSFIAELRKESVRQSSEGRSVDVDLLPVCCSWFISATVDLSPLLTFVVAAISSIDSKSTVSYVWFSTMADGNSEYSLDAPVLDPFAVRFRLWTPAKKYAFWRNKQTNEFLK